MKKFLGFAAIAIGSAVITHLALTNYTPRYAIASAFEVAEKNGGIHTFQHAPPTDAWHQWVVTPSPDLLYSTCAYDLSEGPLRITGLPAPAYWSLSFYADNSDNYHTINDVQWGKEPVDILVHEGELQATTSSRVDLIQAATPRGFAVLRLTTVDYATIEEAQRWQNGFACQML